MRASNDNAIYAAAARLEKSLSAHEALAGLITGKLPIPGAETRMDDIETHLDAIRAKLADALAIHETAIRAIEDREVDRDFTRWNNSIRSAA